MEAQCPIFGGSLWLISVIVWEMVWKVIAMWKAGRNNHLGWFICIAIINTVGILPIIYLIMYKKKEAVE